MKAVGIVGTGLYVPEEIRTNDWFRRFDMLPVDTIFDEAGVKERRISAENELPSDMEAKALIAAVENAGISIEDVEMILDGPSIHDQIMPGNAATLQYKSGAINAASMNVETACTSLISQMMVAQGMIATGMYHTVACVVSSNWTKVADYSEKSCTFMGDGAAAIIMQPVSEGKGVLSIQLETQGQHAKGVGINARLPRSSIEHYEHPDYFNPSREKLYFYIDRGLSGLEEIKRLGPTQTPDTAKRALEKINYSTKDIDFLITANPSKLLTEQWRKALDVPLEKTHITIEKFGNMSATTIAANLHEAVTSNKIKDNDVVVICSPAAGFHYAAAVLRWGK